MAVLQPGIQAPSASLPDLTFPFVQCAPYAAVRVWLLGSLGAPFSVPGTAHQEWLVTASSPCTPTSLEGKCLWSQYCSPAYPPPPFWFLVLNLNVFIFSVWSCIILCSNTLRNKALEQPFSKFFTHVRQLKTYSKIFSTGNKQLPTFSAVSLIAQSEVKVLWVTSEVSTQTPEVLVLGPVIKLFLSEFLSV